MEFLYSPVFDVFLPRASFLPQFQPFALCCLNLMSAFLVFLHPFSCSPLFCPSIHAALAPFYDGIRSTSVSTFEASCFKTVLLQCVMVLSAPPDLRGW